MKLGFLGGSFNPIHQGHLRLAQTAGTQFGLDRVLFVPNHIPPHRSFQPLELAPDEMRYAMTVLATLPHPSFLVSTIELRRDGVSYTYDTTVELKRSFPNDELFLISGADTFIHHAWHRFSEILSLLDGLLLAPRAEENSKEVIRKLEEQFPQIASKSAEIRMPPVEVSSTMIRMRIKSGETIKNLVPEPVEEYIRRYQLYREQI